MIQWDFQISEMQLDFNKLIFQLCCLELALMSYISLSSESTFVSVKDTLC